MKKIIILMLLCIIVLFGCPLQQGEDGSNGDDGKNGKDGNIAVKYKQPIRELIYDGIAPGEKIINDIILNNYGIDSFQEVWIEIINKDSKCLKVKTKSSDTEWSCWEYVYNKEIIPFFVNKDFIISWVAKYGMLQVNLIYFK